MRCWRVKHPGTRQCSTQAARCRGTPTAPDVRLHPVEAVQPIGDLRALEGGGPLRAGTRLALGVQRQHLQIGVERSYVFFGESPSGRGFDICVYLLRYFFVLMAGLETVVSIHQGDKSQVLSAKCLTCAKAPSALRI